MTSPIVPRHPSPSAFKLGCNDVHVWLAKLDLHSLQVDSLNDILTFDERSRAEHFQLQRDRDQFTVARGLLRILIGRYLGEEPAILRFGYGPCGKPYLLREYGGDDLRFNVSHSQGMAIYAVASNREVGVDLELIRHDWAIDQIATRSFSSQEAEGLSALPPSTRTDAFFRCWVRKEAYLKARGTGLSAPLNQFEVSLAPGDPVALLPANPDSTGVTDWALHELDVGPNYVAALAVEGHGWRPRFWKWPEGDPSRAG